MAHLEVEPKKSTPWIWILLGLVVLAVLFFLLKGCGNGTANKVATDSTTAVTDTSAGNAVAATQPDWSKVDFNAPETPDADITDKDVSVRGNDQYTIYSLGENILFATDKNTLQGSADAKLMQVTASLKKRFEGAVIGVYGSTDATGDAAHNKQLGTDRANAVKDWLVKSGISTDKISVQSLGETEPVATNDTKTGRQQNRNVSIVAFPAK
ncbi:outer membrane protein OmpA-like peptidoglycan-associated protein [Mucilaginibacter sp. UYP25]|uniref:OmpA family protein n=1 Tax=unclassified Mucilaginibacter TaxID=2617802 RepID=UPI0033951755